MNKKVIEIAEAKEKCAGYPYVYLRELSVMKMGRTEDILSSINWDEIVEAQFFDEASELRFFDAGEGLKAALIEDSPEQGKYDYNDSTHDLEHNGAFGSRITVREYFGYDEDGQLYVSASRLKDWEE